VETAEKDPLEDLKVGAAKLVISLLPNEGGLRWVGGLLPSKFKSTFDGLVTSYKNQMMLALKGDEERAGKALTSIFKDMLTAYSGQIIGTPFDFPSHHLAIREPFDYYQASLYFNYRTGNSLDVVFCCSQMANAYIGSLIEFDRSILRYPERWTKVQEQLAAGENVIMLGNHQSEGDAGESILICIWSLYAQLD
jgi:glycerol-3-phosphate O-acyltransferase